MRRAKYKTRANGLKETSKTYKDFGPSKFCGKKHFYGKTDADVDRKISEFEKSLTNVPTADSVKMWDLAEEWFESKKPTLSPNSVPSYNTKVQEIRHKFRSRKAADLTVQDIHKWLDQKRIQGYSQRAISDRRSVMKQILDYAILHYGLQINPCRELPTVKGQPAKKRHPASDEDVKRIEENKTNGMFGRLYYFLEYTGCRIGEAAVLQHKDIDYVNHKINISKTLAFKGNLPVVKPNPKTKAGERCVDLYENVEEILPKSDDPDQFVFFPDGLPHQSNFQKMKKRYQKKIGISATPHQLRHTYAGIMHSAEIDAKDTQARMGHANISVTMDIYSEIERDHNEKVRNKANQYILEERLGRNKKRCPNCGSENIMSADGTVFKFCPDCGAKQE